MSINGTITDKEAIFSIGGDVWQEVPNGEYSAICSKVMPTFKWRGIPKLMIYFTISEGPYKGYRARLPYNYSREVTGTTFGQKSKFVNHVMKLFPEMFSDLSKKHDFDPTSLFEKKHFKIKVKLKKFKGKISAKHTFYYNPNKNEFIE